MSPPPDDPSSALSEHRLVSFLRLKIAGEPLPAAAAAHYHDADIYAAEPSLLTARFDPSPAPDPAKKGESGSGSWFFFTHVRPKSSSDSRKSRKVAGGVGTWHSERAPRRVLDDEGNCAGHSQYFSYKLKTGKKCSERTEWYMVEFTDEQEADHERVHGGEPQLVLCKIYKAHTHSRGSSGSASRSSCSASARKRKAVDEASSAPPVKAKRRLFDPSAPDSAASSQEQVSFTNRSNLMCQLLDSPAPALVASSQDQLNTTTRSNLMCQLFDSPAPASVASSQEHIRSTPRSNLLCQLFDSPAPALVVSSQEQIKTTTRSNLMCQLFDSPVPASTSSSQEQLSTTTRSNLGKIGDTFDCTALMSKEDGEAATSQLKIGDTSDFYRFWPDPKTDCNAFMSKADGEAPMSQLKISDTSDFSRFWPEPETVCVALMSKGEGEAATSQLKIGDTSDFSRFWPEPEMAFDPGYTTTGGALPMLENFSRSNVGDVGDLFCGRDAWLSAFGTSNDTTALVCGMPSALVLPPPAFVCGMPSALVLPPPAFVCGMPSAPVLPPPASVCSVPSAPILPQLGEASWWCGSHDIWSY